MIILYHLLEGAKTAKRYAAHIGDSDLFGVKHSIYNSNNILVEEWMAVLSVQ